METASVGFHARKKLEGMRRRRAFLERKVQGMKRTREERERDRFSLCGVHVFVAFLFSLLGVTSPLFPPSPPLV